MAGFEAETTTGEEKPSNLKAPKLANLEWLFIGLMACGALLSPLAFSDSVLADAAPPAHLNHPPKEQSNQLAHTKHSHTKPSNHQTIHSSDEHKPSSPPKATIHPPKTHTAKSSQANKIATSNSSKLHSSKHKATHLNKAETKALKEKSSSPNPTNGHSTQAKQPTKNLSPTSEKVRTGTASGGLPKHEDHPAKANTQTPLPKNNKTVLVEVSGPKATLNPQAEETKSNSAFEATPLEKILQQEEALEQTKQDGSLSQIVVALLVVVGLIIATLAWILPWLQNKGVLPASAAPAVSKALVKVKQVLPLGNNRDVYVVEAADKLLVVGGTSNNLQLLTELPVSSPEDGPKREKVTTPEPATTAIDETEDWIEEPTKDAVNASPPPIHQPTGKPSPTPPSSQAPHYYVPPGDPDVVLLSDYDDEY